MEGDTEELSKLKTEIKQLETKGLVDKSKLKLSEIEVGDEFMIKRLIEELFKANEGTNRNKQMMVFGTVEKLYMIMKQKVARFLTELREELPTSLKMSSSMNGTESQAV
jgi:hypothetical protein